MIYNSAEVMLFFIKFNLQRIVTPISTKEFNSCLDKIRSGNKNAIEPIYNAYYRFVFFTALKEVRNSKYADDIVTELMKDILINTPIEYIENPIAWIATAIHHKATCYVKKELKDFCIANSDIDLSILLIDNIKLLTDKEYEVFNLYFMLGYEAKEISSLLDTPIEIILSHIHSIKEKLQHLEQYI